LARQNARPKKIEPRPLLRPRLGMIAWIIVAGT
jgi:hypothetical protein